MGEVINIPGITVADDTPANVLEKAKNWDMEHCVIVGHDAEGNLAFGGSTSDLEKIIVLLRRAEHWAFNEMGD